MSDSPDRSPGPADAKRPVARFLRLIVMVFATVMALMGIMTLLGWRLDWHVELLIIAALVMASIAEFYFNYRNVPNG